MKLADKLVEQGYEDIIIFEPDTYDSACIGVSSDYRAVYSFDKLVETLMKNDGMTDVEAIEYLEYNTIRALPYIGEGAPIVVYDFWE